MCGAYGVFSASPCLAEDVRPQSRELADVRREVGEREVRTGRYPLVERRGNEGSRHQAGLALDRAHVVVVVHPVSLPVPAPRAGGPGGS